MKSTPKKPSSKLKTQGMNTQSLPKLRLLGQRSTFYPKFNNIFKNFPYQDSINPQILLKQISINLDVAKRIRTSTVIQDPSQNRKILPHHIHSRKSFTKLTGLKTQKQKVLNDDNVIHITAQKWLIYDYSKEEVIKGFKYKKQHDVASLSKLLTFYVAFMIIKQFKLSIDKVDFIVMKQDQILGGSKIPLKQQQIITLQDVLYAMLLNSANNAATVLANNLGFLCLRKKQGRYFSCFDINQSNRTSNIQFYVELMNKYIKKLQLKDTVIQNPHGMSKNISTAKDIAKLFEFCWKISLFRKIMETKQRNMQIRFVDNQGKLCNSTLKLRTTNKMDFYNKFCIAGKTGQNKNGAHSFVSYFQDPFSNKKFIIVVLGSFGRQQKFRDTDKLYEWLNSKSQSHNLKCQ